MGANVNWPVHQPKPSSGARPVQTLYGRRRLDWFSRHANGFAQEYRKAPLVGQMAKRRFSCAPVSANTGAARELQLSDSGDVVFGSSDGRWGAMNDPMLGAACPPYACLFVDVPGQQMNGHVQADGAKLTLLANPYRADATSPLWKCDEQH